MSRCPSRAQWLEALPYHKEYAPAGCVLHPPSGDEDRVGFLDDLWFYCANAAGGACIRLFPKDREGGRPVLKRVYKKISDDGRPNPNYGRFYLTNGFNSHMKYFEWLTETMWWRSYLYKRCLPEAIVRELETTGGPVDAPLWTGNFEKLYGSEQSIDEIVEQLGGVSQSSVVSGTPQTPLQLPPMVRRYGTAILDDVIHTKSHPKDLHRLAVAGRNPAPSVPFLLDAEQRRRKAEVNDCRYRGEVLKGPPGW